MVEKRQPPARIRAIRTDITTLAVDAIVNAANERMLGGGGVDGAIHRAAGPGLLQECRRVPEVRPGVRCPTGEARRTGGHQLRARYVIHTVGPVWRGGTAGEAALLRSCYRSCLRLAAESEVRTIAFPAISCGVYGYPIERAAVSAVQELKRFLKDHSIPELVLLVAFSESVHRAIEAALQDDAS